LGGGYRQERGSHAAAAGWYQPPALQSTGLPPQPGSHVSV